MSRAAPSPLYVVYTTQFLIFIAFVFNLLNLSLSIQLYELSFSLTSYTSAMKSLLTGMERMDVEENQ